MLNILNKLQKIIEQYSFYICKKSERNPLICGFFSDFFGIFKKAEVRKYTQGRLYFLRV